ncbi:Keratin, type I cytoskeletal 42 [Oryzias melastigma]|uniref:Keratin, type I cytoskeletal 42 n=1 Tax=Oryzias melastigma TaxID=30732 RepID=A0A834L2F7_ORYME|nr:Keratin, type I cytoskeletal 42 [Oryzias melastigma]
MSFSSASYSRKTMSVYGGAGGSDTRISRPSWVHGGLDLTDASDFYFGDNKKATMQNLNYRLASYLEKVRRLEKENEQLEKKIREWYKSRTVVSHDFSKYLDIIKDLQDKICVASKLNTKNVLEIDNARLAVDDFRMKYESELSMRMAVEADIAGLRRLLDDSNLRRMELESRCEGLREELIVLKKDHEEELALLKKPVESQVNVVVDAPPTSDLNEAMKEIRDKYESLIAKNHTEIEMWYNKKILEVEHDVKRYSEDLKTSNTEIKELKSTFQRLQIDLESHLSMKASLEETLSETHIRYGAQLTSLQEVVSSLEAQLSQIHGDMVSNGQEYSILLQVKTRLEREIAEYRRLLEGEDESSKQGWLIDEFLSSSSVITKVITVVETVVDGKVVESSKTVDVDVDNVE